MNVGNRIYFNEKGDILFMGGEMSNGIQRPVDEVVQWVDLEYGSIDYNKQRILSVNVESKKLILEDIEYETPEEKRIRELEEDIELLKADSEIGGIL